MTLAYLEDNIVPLGAIKKAGQLIIWAGINDILGGDNADMLASRLRSIIQTIPPTVDITIINLAPLGENRPDKYQQTIIKTNQLIGRVCTGRCHVVDIYRELTTSGHLLAKAYDAGDGLHFNKNAYGVIADQLLQIMEARE